MTRRNETRLMLALAIFTVAYLNLLEVIFP